MKKQGFTLAELLITLGIIGVAAALAAPALHNLMPDKNKLTVLKYYNNIANATAKLLDNNAIYYSYTNDEGKADCYGLNCTQQALDPQYKDSKYSGDNKYPNLLSNMLGIESNSLSDGSVWKIEKDTNNYIITVDVNGDKKPNASYSKSYKKTPDTFIFKIDFHGNVTGGDPLTTAYISNPTNANNKKEDFDNAAKILAGGG